MTAGQDKTLRLWNPFRSDPEDLNKALLIQTFTGPHSYEASLRPYAVRYPQMPTLFFPHKTKRTRTPIRNRSATWP